MRSIFICTALLLLPSACDRPVTVSTQAESVDLRIATFNIGVSEDTHELVKVSDHRLVWLDISL
jgi:hypothetical protein